MSMPGWMRVQFHKQEEETATKLPYDPSVPSRVIIKPTTPDPNQTPVVWDKNPWDMFERKIVLAYTGNKRRIELLKQEFARVGLDDVEVLWNFNDSYIPILKKNVTAQKEYSDAIFNNTMGHYRMIKSSYELGCTSCLIMEDDIRFLRDVGLMKDILLSLPRDYDLAMLDSVPGAPLKGNVVNEYWALFKQLWTASCYALSKNGMRFMIRLYEANLLGIDHQGFLPLRSSDEYFDTDLIPKYSPNRRLNFYFAATCVARQTKVESSKTNTGYDGWSVSYDDRGCKRERYGK